MPARRSVKVTAWTPQIVAVIFSPADLQRALRMRNPPDLFELRLDGLAPRIEEVKRAIAELRAPLIITARHPREGGSNKLSARKRRALLQEFFPHASYVDIELRSARELAAVLEEARANRIRTIISFHDFNGTPSDARLDEIARRVHSLGVDILKIATRIDTPAELSRLLDFFERHRTKMKIAAMGIGRLGGISRFEFAKRGSALNYVHLGTRQAAGQLSITEYRRRR